MFIKTEEIVVLTKMRTTVFKKLLDWKGNRFESSSVKTPEFKAFAKRLGAHIKKQARENGLQLVGFSVGHFYCSGFFKNTTTDKFAYFSISDVRYWPDGWIDNILIRTAKHEKDYTGGPNQYTIITNLGKEAQAITQ